LPDLQNAGGLEMGENSFAFNLVNENSRIFTICTIKGREFD
jgi:hypothetical protein